MAEALKGDVEVEADGELFTLRFGGAAMMALEASFPGRNFLAILEGLREPDSVGATPVTDVAKLTHAALRLHHPGMTLDEAAEIAITEPVQIALAEAIKLSLPVAKGRGAAAEGDPPKAPTPARARGGRKTS